MNIIEEIRRIESNAGVTLTPSERAAFEHGYMLGTNKSGIAIIDHLEVVHKRIDKIIDDMRIVTAPVTDINDEKVCPDWALDNPQSFDIL